MDLKKMVKYLLDTINYKQIQRHNVSNKPK